MGTQIVKKNCSGVLYAGKVTSAMHLLPVSHEISISDMISLRSDMMKGNI